MRKIQEHAWAKLNLTLDVTGRMDSGYHAMEMIMQTCSLCDDVVLAAQPGAGAVTVRTDRSFLPRDEENIAGKAIRAFLTQTGISGWDVDVALTKRIPVCAGLGGGSADAAAVLRGLNALFETGLPAGTLCEIGGQVGSDVPFCVAGGTALACGRGEILTMLPPLPSCAFVVCKPEMSISTPELFARIDCGKIRCRPDTAAAAAALAAGDLRGIVCRMYNVFEDVLGKRAGPIAEMRNALYDCGAIGTVMSGTGSAVFGVFPDMPAAQAAVRRLAGRFDFCTAAEPVGALQI